MMRISSLQLSLIVLVCVIVSLHAYRLYGPYESYPSYNNRWHRVTKSQFGPMEAVQPRRGQDEEYLEKLVRYLNLVGRKVIMTSVTCCHSNYYPVAMVTMLLSPEMSSQ